MKKKLYIAYGSNLNLKQMERRCPDAEILGTAMLKDYELEFRSVATVVPKKGSAVPVLIWKISQQDEKNLDSYEGFPLLYRKEEYEIDLNGEKITGMAYVMNGGQICSPVSGYQRVIAQGYEENHLNPEFLHQALCRAKMQTNDEEMPEIGSISI